MVWSGICLKMFNHFLGKLLKSAVGICSKCLMLSSCTYKHPGWCGCHCMDTRTPMYNKENTYLSIFLQVRVEMTQHKDKNTQVQHREHLLVHPPSHPHTRLEWKWHSTKTRTPSYNTENTILLILFHIQVGVKMVQQKDKNTQVQHRTTIHPPPHPGWCKNDTAQRQEHSHTTQRTPTSSSSSTARLVWKWHSTKPWILRYNTENTYLFILLHIQVGMEVTKHEDKNDQVQDGEHWVHPQQRGAANGKDVACYFLTVPLPCCTQNSSDLYIYKPTLF